MARSSDEATVMDVEQRSQVIQLKKVINQKWEESFEMARSFSISKQVVWLAYKRVKANKGAEGVDEQTI